MNIETMKCRRCKRDLVANGPTYAPKSYEDCRFKCLDCGVAYSNGKIESARTMIWREFTHNVPAEVRGGLGDALARSLNRRNRRAKIWKFAFETSEDAITWTVFRHLREADKLVEAFGATTALESILLWGNGGVEDNLAIRRLLVRLLTDVFHENPASFSEPDVVLAFRDELVFVEAKFKGGNSCKPEYRHWAKYLSDLSMFRKGIAVDELKQAGYEELVRNWVVGATLARTMGRRFRLVNLGQTIACCASALRFKRYLSHYCHQVFEFKKWSELVTVTEPHPLWFRKFALNRQIISL